MSEGASAGGNGGDRGAPVGKHGKPYSDHPEAVKARRKRMRRAVRKALETAPVPARPGTQAAAQMATTKLVESGVIRRARAGRMYEVEQMLFRGASYGQILRRICADFGVSESTVAADITALKPGVARAIEESIAIPASERRAADREMLVDLYDRCIASGDKATAQRVADRIARIDGAYAPVRIDIAVRPVGDAESEAAARALVDLLGASDGRIVDAQATERPDEPVRVLPAPEEMH